jgi:hypothetical protein
MLQHCSISGHHQWPQYECRYLISLSWSCGRTHDAQLSGSRESVLPGADCAECPTSIITKLEFWDGWNCPFVMLFHLTFMNNEKGTRPGLQTDSTKTMATAFLTNQRRLSRLLCVCPLKRRRSLLVAHET